MTRAFLAFLIVSFAACSLPTGSDPVAVIRLASSSTLSGDTIRAELVNRSSEPVGYGACSLFLDQRAGDGWVAVAPERQYCILPLYSLASGSALPLKLLAPSSLPSGVYRLRHQIVPRRKGADIEVYSEPFTISRPG
jgi:hypothetical protein